MRRRTKTALCAGIAAALVTAVAGRAAAHGGEGAELRPVLDPLPAALAGMRVELRETLGSQLVLENPTPRTVEVLDETGVPFLRIGPRGVEGNLAAPAWYRTLGPASAVPASAAPGAEPRWMRASREPSYGWFDPRLAAAGVARWEVPLRVDGERVALSGRFRSEPPATGSYTARLTSPSEIAPGVRVTLLPGRAPGLLVHNASKRPLLVFGADGEPFLRIDAEGVDANLRSRAWQQSARSASVPTQEVVEADALVPDARAAPEWRRVASVPRFGWIEPRALVTSAPPEAARNGAPTDVLEWGVPMQLGDQRVLVTGVVSWRPRSDAVAGAHSESR
jgi:hypothetical protein